MLSSVRKPVALGLVVVAIALGWVAARRVAPAGLVRQTFDHPDLRGAPSPMVLDRRIDFDTEGGDHPWVREKMSARWLGWIELPRDGTYRWELISDDGSRLLIDGEVLVDNWGQHPRRAKRADRWHRRGVYPITVEYANHTGGGSLEVRWRLPSGYHSLGELPAGVLSPTRPYAPDAVDFALRHGVWLCLLAALLLWWGPGRLLAPLRQPGVRRVAMAGAGILAVALTVRLADLGGQGETCDEWAYVGAGHIYAQNLAGGVFFADQWNVNREHPAVGKLFYAGLLALFGDHPNVPRAGAAVLNGLTVLLAFWIAWRLGGLLCAVAAGLVLALLPPVLAHANIGTLDTPLTFLYTLAVGLFLLALEDERRRTAALLGVGLATGLAIGVKFSAGLLLPWFFGVWLVWHWRTLRATGQVPMPWALYVAPLLMALPTALTWPWLWSDTLGHLTETLSHWKKTPGAEVFMGEDLRERPRSYFLVWFGAALPAATIALGAIGAGWALVKRDRRWLVVLAWFGLPFLWSFVSLRQGGYRYVYPAFVPFGVLCGLGVARVAALLPRAGGPAMIGTLAVYLALIVARVHPYHHYYFNEWVGGAGAAYQRGLFEVGFWGEGLDRTVDWLNEHAEPGASWGFQGNVNHTMLGLRDDLQHREGRAAYGADYLVRDSLRPTTAAVPGYEQVYAVEVDGAPIAAVYRRQR